MYGYIHTIKNLNCEYHLSIGSVFGACVSALILVLKLNQLTFPVKLQTD